jgi:protein SCO1/2
MKNLKIIAAVFIVFGALFVGFNYLQNKAKPVAISATTIPVPYEISDFHLTTAEGKDFTRQNLLGKYTVLFFGFTRCPDVCPTTLAQFKIEIPKLTKEAHENVQFLLVTVDPEHDTQEILKSYVSTYNSEIHAATGSVAEIHKVADAMKTTFSKEEENAGDPNLYMMAHSPRYFVIDPQARLSAVYNPPIAPGVLSADLNALTAASFKTRGIF